MDIFKERLAKKDESRDRLRYFGERTGRRSLSAPRLAKIHIKKIGSLRDLHVWIVAGRTVRDSLDIDFIGGAHPARYQYVPINELWVEVGLVNTWEGNPILVHQFIEYLLMKDESLSYSNAHDWANTIERRFRSQFNPEPSINLPSIESFLSSILR